MSLTKAAAGKAVKSRSGSGRSASTVRHELKQIERSLAERGGTAMNDHSYLALKQLEARRGRRVIVLLSDGLDT